MKGSVFRYRKGWAGVIDLDRGLDGKRRQRWVYGKSKKETQAKLAETFAALRDGSYIEPSKVTVGEFLEKWLGSVKSSVSTKTHERYEELVNDHLRPGLGAIPLQKLTGSAIEDHYAASLLRGRKDGKGGLSKQSVLHEHRVLRQAMKKAVRWGLLFRNPVDLADPPKPERKEQLTFTTEEVVNILDAAANTRIYLPIVLAVTAGLRRGEILGLRWLDIDFKAKRLSVRQILQETRGTGTYFKEPKTQQSTRVVTLPELAIEALLRHKASEAALALQMGSGKPDDNLLFHDVSGEPWAPSAMTSCYRGFIKKHGFKPVSFHGLRHSHATHLLEANIHPKVVSERLGHSTIKITLDLYSHVLPTIQEAVTATIDQALQSSGRKSD